MADTNLTSSPIAVSLRMSQALSLARRGDFQGAQQSLSPDGLVPTDPLLLQASAAVATSSGDYQQALSLWQMLLVRDPQNAEAKRMIGSIELWLSRPSWVRYVPLIAGLLVAALFSLGLWWALADNEVPKKPAVVPYQAPITTPASTQRPPRPR